MFWSLTLPSWNLHCFHVLLGQCLFCLRVPNNHPLCTPKYVSSVAPSSKLPVPAIPSPVRSLLHVQR